MPDHALLSGPVVGHEIFWLGGHKTWASKVATELYDQFKARTLRVQGYVRLMQYATTALGCDI